MKPKRKYSKKLTERDAMKIIQDFRSHEENSYMDVAARTGYTYWQVSRVLGKL